MLRRLVKGLIALARSSDDVSTAAVDDYRRQVVRHLLQRASVEPNHAARRAFLEASRAVATYPDVPSIDAVASSLAN